MTTTKAAHTPGPWEWYWRKNANDKSEADCGVFWQLHEGQAVSVCRAPRFETQSQWEANARLIAAAPELETALDAAPEMDSWALMTSEEREETIGGYLIWYHNQRKTAIQKARGGA